MCVCMYRISAYYDDMCDADEHDCYGSGFSHLYSKDDDGLSYSASQAASCPHI